VWPEIGPISYTVPKAEGPGYDTRTTANPNRIHINGTTLAIADAVVYLRQFDPSAARPWDLPAARVEINDQQITVVQGLRRGRVGFVRRGDSVAIESTQSSFQILRARGDSFFSVTLPVPHDPVIRQLNRSGRVELSSGTGSSWMRADLFVSDHPYYTLTDGHGRFDFEFVPSGPAELVVWLPNWEAGLPIREPESSIITRQTYAPPLERIYPVLIASGQVTSLDAFVP
jgi:hypothetical protein